MSLIEVPEPWTSAQATERIRAIACGEFTLSYTEHALDQLADRDLLIGDLNYLLRNGFVYVTAYEAAQKPYWKYQIECTTPNSRLSR